MRGGTISVEVVLMWVLEALAILKVGHKMFPYPLKDDKFFYLRVGTKKVLNCNFPIL